MHKSMTDLNARKNPLLKSTKRSDTFFENNRIAGNKKISLGMHKSKKIISGTLMPGPWVSVCVFSENRQKIIKK